MVTKYRFYCIQYQVSNVSLFSGDRFPKDDPSCDDQSIPDSDNADDLNDIQNDMRASDSEWHLEGSVDEADSSDDEIKALHGSENEKELSDISDQEEEKSEKKMQIIVVDNRKVKKHNCFFCNKLYPYMAKHLKRKHYKEEDVAKALLYPKYSKERNYAWAELLSRGDFAHNSEVIKRGYGTLITKTVRNKKKTCCLSCKQYISQDLFSKHTSTCSKLADKKQGDGSVERHIRETDNKDKNTKELTWKEYLPCQFCLSFYKRYCLTRHQKNCNMKPKETNGSIQLKGIAGGKRLLPRQVSHEDFHNNLLMHLREDDIRDIVMGDETILQYGMYLYDEGKTGKKHLNFLSARLRLLGRLLKILKRRKIKTLADCMTASKWDVFIETVKELAEFNANKGVYGIPNTAKNVGIVMRQCAENLHYTCRKKDETEKLEKVDSFLKIYNASWDKEVGARPQASLSYHKKNKPSVPDLIKDMDKLNQLLTVTADKLLDGENQSNGESQSSSDGQNRGKGESENQKNCDSEKERNGDCENRDKGEDKNQKNGDGQEQSNGDCQNQDKDGGENRENGDGEKQSNGDCQNQDKDGVNRENGDSEEQSNGDGQNQSLTTGINETYEDLTEVCLLHIALLNAAVIRDVERMTVKQFKEAKKGGLDSSIKDRLGKFDQKLFDSRTCKYVEVGVGAGTKVPILLTRKLEKGIKKLLSMREHIHIENDKYVFGKLGLFPGNYRVEDCLRKYAAKCGVENLRAFKSKSCKKHIAVIMKVLNFGQSCKEVLSTFQDHGIVADVKDDLRKRDTLLTAKVAKLLVSVDTKEVEKFKDCQFKEIDLNLNGNQNPSHESLFKLFLTITFNYFLP